MVLTLIVYLLLGLNVESCSILGLEII
uniref:Uncharacterized protein n=1 Tax=Rhizophora mucronata TaxID=61149 RepID=A0A2P2PEJ8_RHIMU